MNIWCEGVRVQCFFTRYTLRKSFRRLVPCYRSGNKEYVTDWGLVPAPAVLGTPQIPWVMHFVGIYCTSTVFRTPTLYPVLDYVVRYLVLPSIYRGFVTKNKQKRSLLYEKISILDTRIQTNFAIKSSRQINFRSKFQRRTRSLRSFFHFYLGPHGTNRCSAYQLNGSNVTFFPWTILLTFGSPCLFSVVFA